MIAAVTSCGGDGGGVTGTKHHPDPPVITELTVAPASDVQPGDTLTISFVATASTPLAGTVVRVSGAFAATDSVVHTGLLSVSRVLRLGIPATASLATQLEIRVDAYTASGVHGAETAAPITLIDRTPPDVSAFLGGNALTTFVPDDTLHFLVTASDNGLLKWVGYRFGTVSDSQAVDGTNVLQWNVSLPLPSSLVGSSTPLTTFATDAGAQRTETAGPHISVIDGIHRPTHAVAMPETARDIAFDDKRNVLYLSEPSVSHIAVLSLGTMAFGAPIAVPAIPAGLDLSVSGDSLIIALRSSRQLGVADLTQPAPVIRTVDLPIGTSLGEAPDNIRVMGNGKAIVSITFNGTGLGGQLMEYDLSTQIATIRSDAGKVTEEVPLLRSASRTKLLLLLDDQCCPLFAQIYDALTNTFSGAFGTIDEFEPSVSADSAGDRYLVRSSVYRDDLSLVRTLTPTDYLGGPSVISLDGTAVYFETDYGYVKVRIADQAVLERVVLPTIPLGMMLLPNRDALIVFGGDGTIMSVDLR